MSDAPKAPIDHALERKRQAAPEMFEALRRLIHCEDNIDFRHWNDAMRDARTAFAKARGEA